MSGSSRDNWFERYRADSEIQFFGTITASVSHELNNVISILNQTGGLLEDLLYGAQQGQEITSENLERIASKIAAQTDRGISIIRRLNSFAHTVDEPIMEFDLGELLGNLMALCGRFAALRGIELTDNTGGGRITVKNSPIGVQQVVFLLIRDILGTGQKGDTVSYSIEEGESGTVIVFRLANGREPELPNLESTISHSEEIGATIEVIVNQEQKSVRINLPKQYIPGRE